MNPALAWSPDDGTRVRPQPRGPVRSRMPPTRACPSWATTIARRAAHALVPVAARPLGAGRLPRCGSTPSARSRALRLRAKALLHGLRLGLRRHAAGGRVPVAGRRSLVGRSLLMLDDRQTALGNQLEAGVVGRALGVAARAAGRRGGRAASATASPSTSACRRRSTLEDPVETTGEPRGHPARRVRAAGDARSIILAPYLVDRIALGERCRPCSGARLDVLDFEEPLTGTDRHDTQLSPMAGPHLHAAPGRDRLRCRRAPRSRRPRARWWGSASRSAAASSRPG